MTDGTVRMKLLIFIVAYNAEGTLLEVLDRIPASLFERADVESHVLVLDDSSSDDTAGLGLRWKEERPALPLTVLRHPVNLGYGGNQKVGYRFAIDHGFDAVALVHGDAQYAPEELPRLIEPLLSDGPDAVFGSRMLGWSGSTVRP